MMSVVLVSAKSADIKNLFVEMPDSIMPLLVKNNRLDMLDYMDIGMSAKVKNKLGGESEMTLLKDDMISISMTDVAEYDIKLFYGKDSLVTIAVIETVKGGYSDSNISFYNTKWEKLNTTNLIKMPVLEDFINKKSLRNEENKKLLDELIYRMFVVDVAPDTNTLSVAFSSAEYIIDEDVRNSIFARYSIIYRWNGKKFIRQKDR
mgnify:FL=1